MDLCHLIYASTATNAFSDEQLKELLIMSRLNNKKWDLTGMLLHSNGNFFQVLEGSPENIKSLFEIIKRDERHQSITQIIYEPIAKRDFDAWTMGFVNLDESVLNELTGSNDFFSDATCFTNLDSGRAKKLLKAFSSGHWQKSIQ